MDLEAALETLDGLRGLSDDDLIEDWSIFDLLKQELRLAEKDTERLFKNNEEPFAARHVRTMLRKRGTLEAVTNAMVTQWSDEKTPEVRSKAEKANKRYKGVYRRYKAALGRRRPSRGVPEDAALDIIQRYESHLERRLHKALERLQALQEAGTAVPSTINLAVVQSGYREPEMASFGSLPIEANKV